MSDLAIIFPWKEPKSRNKVMAYISIKCYTFLLQTMGDKSVETVGSKIQFLSVLDTFSPLLPQTMLIFYFLDYTDHSVYTMLNCGGRDIRELMLGANKIEQVLKYQKASFPKCLNYFCGPLYLSNGLFHLKICGDVVEKIVMHWLLDHAAMWQGGNMAQVISYFLKSQRGLKITYFWQICSLLATK